MRYAHYQSIKFYFVAFCLAFFSSSLAYAGEHTESGTNYGKEGIDIYTQMKHGPDGALFLDPYFIPYLLNLDEKVLLDAGCGAGPWSIFAAKQGACVYGVDIQEGMIAKAKQAALEEHVENSTHFIVGDVGQLPFEDNFFDQAISINVGCNLPDLRPHLQELYRVLKEGGVAIITAPHSFGTVFTDGQKKHEVIIAHIESLLTEGQASFPQVLQDCNNVYRATFANQAGRWSLILDEAVLESKLPIYRKIPGMVVLNYYHGLNEYISMIAEEGFWIKSLYTPHFLGQYEWETYYLQNKCPLGKEYITASPFAIFVIEKGRVSICE